MITVLIKKKSNLIKLLSYFFDKQPIQIFTKGSNFIKLDKAIEVNLQKGKLNKDWARKKQWDILS